MTPAQFLVLKNDILVTNNASLQVFVDATDDQSIAAWYNELASPDYWVYVTRLSKAQVVKGTSQDGTVFTLAGNGFIGRTVGEILTFEMLFSIDGTVDASSLPIRTAFVDIFSGTGNAQANRSHLASLSRRKATRFERLFATGTGSTASPATMALEGELSYLDVVQALRPVGV